MSENNPLHIVLDVDASTLPYSWSTAGIGDARAFRVGESHVVHSPKSFTPRRVVGVCGVVGYACETDTRLATWAAGVITCPTCKARK